MRHILLLLIGIGGVLHAAFLKENFEHLMRWEPLTFEKIPQHSVYEIQDSVLVLKSNNSASALRLKKTYNSYEYPIVSFKWKVTTVYEKGNAKTKEGDDYPIRIYLLFEYDPLKASFFESIQYDVAKSFYGEYPPHSTLNYIWSNQVHSETMITSSYTDRSKMIPLNQGKKGLNQWHTHRVNIVEDYKKAFGENPPNTVSIAVMIDSDNTKESAMSYLDYIEVLSE